MSNCCIGGGGASGRLFAAATCRGCSFKSPHNKSLFHQRPADADAAHIERLTASGELFAKCIQLPIGAHDGYPHRICDQCVAVLRVYAEFQKSVVRMHEVYTCQLAAAEREDNGREMSNDDDHDVGDAGVVDAECQAESTKSDEKNSERRADDDCDGGEDGAEDDIVEELELDGSMNEIYLDEMYLNDEEQQLSATAASEEEEGTHNDESSFTDQPTPMAAADSANISLAIEPITNTNTGDSTLPAIIDTAASGAAPAATATITARRRQTKPHQCAECRSRFACARAMQLHVCATGKVQYACPTCAKLFRSASAVDEHALRHSASRQFGCDQCDRFYKTPNDLHLHRRVHAQRSERKYRCERCAYATQNRTQLVHHMNTHAGVKPHACPVCAKRFRRREVVREHVLTMHTEKAQHVCDVCGAAFGLARRLARHMTIHTRSGDIGTSQ